MIRRKKRATVPVPLATMGDIAFQLIIFFVLTSTFMKSSNIDLVEPKSPDVDEIKKPATVVLTVDI